jgi:hypothetical protein
MTGKKKSEDWGSEAQSDIGFTQSFLTFCWFRKIPLNSLSNRQTDKKNIFSGPDTKNVKVNIPSSKWMMKMYMSATPLYNMPLDLTGLLPLGKEVKVRNPISRISWLRRCILEF